MRLRTILVVLGLAWASLAGPAAAAGRTLLGVACQSPPPLRCSPGGCTAAERALPGNALDPKTGRRFFLDYPCDLKPGDKVVFILLLHGAGSTGQWVRHYFPAMDLKEKYRLVIATPTAAGGGPTPVRMWLADADDTYLREIADLVMGAVGRRNIRAFWLAGHSQGGLTVNRIVCDPYFKGRADGWLSLSGGRIGSAPLNPEFFKGLDLKGFPPGAGPPGGAPGIAVTPACDMNFIFATGEHEIQSLPEASPWADRYACAPRRRHPTWSTTSRAWSTTPAPARPTWPRGPTPARARPRCSSTRAAAAAAWWPTWSASTRATPRAWSHASPSGSSS